MLLEHVDLYAAAAAAADEPAASSTLFEGLLRSPPGRPAIRLANAMLTYGTVHRRARALAAHLNENGVGPGDRVLVRGTRSPNTVIAIYAVLMAGASYLTIDAGADTAAIHEINLRASTTTVLGDDDDDIARTTSSPVMWSLNFDTFLEGCADDPEDSFPIYPLPPDQPALTVFAPCDDRPARGVVVSHKALVASLAALAQHLSIGPDDCLQAPPVLTDHAAAFELFVPLLAGCSMSFASNTEAAVTLRRCDPESTDARPAGSALLVAEMAYAPLVRGATERSWRPLAGVAASVSEDGTLAFESQCIASEYANEGSPARQAFGPRRDDGRRVFQSTLRAARAADSDEDGLRVDEPPAVIGWRREHVA